MAFTVEDGTGLTGANALISVADADAYFADTGNTTWTGSDTVKEQAIVKATRYMEKRFGTRYKGTRASSTQGIAFPRDYLYDELGTLIEGVPTPIAQACAEYALQALSNPLIPAPIYPVQDGARIGTGAVQRRLEKVGPIQEETYHTTGKSGVASGSSLVDADNLVQYPEADFLVGPYLRSRSTVVRG